MWWRRRSREPETAQLPATRAAASAGGLTPRVERALIALAVQAQQIDNRLERLERRLEDCELATGEAATHDDILLVRLHSAKVAAEVARVNVELRAEIEQRIKFTDRERRAHTLADTIIDLSDSWDTRPVDLHLRDSA